MSVVDVRPADEVRHDVVCLGEVMLRLDPGEGQVRTARRLAVSEGGGEYNVGRALRRCFGHRVALVTALGDDDVAQLLEDLLLQGGVDLAHVVRRTSDPVGRRHRTPLNFTERGFGVRGGRGTYDRAHSAASTLAPDDVDWDHLLGDLGARWLHTGGIFAGLSDATFASVRAATSAARRHGAVVSYDVNYRPSLWAAAGGPDAARGMTGRLVADVDVLLGVDAERFDDEVERLAAAHPDLAVVATTRREVRSASRNGWAAVGWSRADGKVEVDGFDDLEVLDRVGGGDGFASGLVHGLLTGRPLDEALRLGLAHGALVMTTPGDTSSARLDEVERLAAGGDAGVTR